MTNLEIMEKAIQSTRTIYYNQYSNLVEMGSMSSQELEIQSIQYSSDVLFKVLNSVPGVYSAYTRQENLRQEMMNLSFDSIKTELLKNIVNVAVYNRINDTRAGNRIGNLLVGTLTDDEIAVILFNNLVDNGVEKGFEILNNPNILESACRTFAYYKSSDKKMELDNIAATNNAASYVNDEIDVYYARFCDRRIENAGFGAK